MVFVAEPLIGKPPERLARVLVSGNVPLWTEEVVSKRASSDFFVVTSLPAEVLAKA